MTPLRRSLLLAALVSAAAAVLAPARLAEIDFARDVQPLLARRCVECHSGDDPDGGLRLDSWEGALAGARHGGKPVIVPGDAAASLLVRLVESADEDARMPSGGDSLPASEIAILRAWIDGGARGPVGSEDAPAARHWAWTAPVRPEPPAVSDPSWCRSPIDRFVRARLDAEGLAPSPEADRATWLRRAALALTGIPPTLAELDAFLADGAPDAFERAVDGLLASPRYGERMARPWLDLARFADTNGYEKDARRSHWPWRDGLIAAWNDDQPFDRFTIEQLAGDLLPGATLAQRVATGFHRNTMVNQEGGVDPEEFRVAAVVDRVNTTATVWLGSTLACAQCHDHKYDAFSQEEYYRLFAFFDSTADSGSSTAPELRVPSPEQARALDAADAHVRAQEQALAAPDAALDAAQRAWVETERARPPREEAIVLSDWETVGPFRAPTAHEALVTAFAPEMEALSGGPVAREYANGALRWEARPDWTDGVVHALRGESSAFYLLRTVRSAEPRRIRIALGSDDSVRLWIGATLVHSNETARPAAPGQDVVEADLPAGESRLLLKVVNGGGPAGFCFETDGRDPRAPSPELRAILQRPEQERSAEESAALREHYGRLVSERGRAMHEALARARDAREEIARAIPTTLVLEELPEPRETHVLIRGSFLNRGARVAPGTPAVLHPFPEDAPRNRLGLARWLVDPRNPLTARVEANRLWAALFGEGLVRTPDDFGTRGDRPSHPGLLDWLATELVARGWKRKAIVREIVLSATFRQASDLSAALRERDPENRLLARGPRRRLDAETLRDAALAVANLLQERIGGPSVFPPQPEGTWNVVYNGDRWRESAGAARHRRGIYTFQRRTAPYPTFALFDAPSRELSCPRRADSNTPLQALALLNDPVFVEAAGGLARRMLGAAGEDRARVAHGFRLCTARVPSEQETAVLLRLLDAQRARYGGDDAAARALAAVAGDGDGEGGGALTAAEIAAWTVVANVLLNLDETITGS